MYPFFFNWNGMLEILIILNAISLKLFSAFQEIRPWAKAVSSGHRLMPCCFPASFIRKLASSNAYHHQPICRSTKLVIHAGHIFITIANISVISNSLRFEICNLFSGAKPHYWENTVQVAAQLLIKFAGFSTKSINSPPFWWAPHRIGLGLVRQIEIFYFP